MTGAESHGSDPDSDRPVIEACAEGGVGDADGADPAQDREPTTTDVDVGSPGGDSRLRRYPCPWCELPDVWPDRCVEERSNGRPSEAFRCAEMIEKHCARGDHRRCAVGACTVSTRWHEPVRVAAIVAARATGKAWVVVSTIHSGVELAGTVDVLEHAERLRRRTLHNAGREDDAEGRGLVYVVRGSDGRFL